jgi:hypothetical protein
MIYLIIWLVPMIFRLAVFILTLVFRLVWLILKVTWFVTKWQYIILWLLICLPFRRTMKIRATNKVRRIDNYESQIREHVRSR